MDNVHLLAGSKYTKSSPDLLKTRFKYGMVLIGMAILKESSAAEIDGSDVDEEESVFDRRRWLTRAVSPVPLAMISSFGDVDLADVGMTSTVAE